MSDFAVAVAVSVAVALAACVLVHYMARPLATGPLKLKRVVVTKKQPDEKEKKKKKGDDDDDDKSSSPSNKKQATATATATTKKQNVRFSCLTGTRSRRAFRFESTAAGAADTNPRVSGHRIVDLQTGDAVYSDQSPDARVLVATDHRSPHSLDTLGMAVAMAPDPQTVVCAHSDVVVSFPALPGEVLRALWVTDGRSGRVQLDTSERSVEFPTNEWRDKDGNGGKLTTVTTLATSERKAAAAADGGEEQEEDDRKPELRFCVCTHWSGARAFSVRMVRPRGASAWDVRVGNLARNDDECWSSRGVSKWATFGTNPDDVCDAATLGCNVVVREDKAVVVVDSVVVRLSLKPGENVEFVENVLRSSDVPYSAVQTTLRSLAFSEGSWYEADRPAARPADTWDYVYKAKSQRKPPRESEQRLVAKFDAR